MGSFYKDFPLQEQDSIRVLKICPGDSATVMVQPELVRLSDKPKFLALSYAWGDPFGKRLRSFEKYGLDKYHISCAGERLLVTVNLYEAVLQLREKQKQNLLPSLPIWIDQIYINQNNESEEKNHQLPLMQRIYGEASEVIVWLGRDDPTTHEAVQILKNLRHRLEEPFLKPPGADDTLQLCNIDRGERQFVMSLVQRTWFNRVWTVQEVLMPRRVRCFCGPCELDVLAPSLFAAVLQKTVSDGHSSSDIFEDWEKFHGQVSGAACIVAWEGLTSETGGFGERSFLRYPVIDWKYEIPYFFKWLVALEHLVHEVRQRNCHNPKDKVLAPISFALGFGQESFELRELKCEARGMLDDHFPVADLYTKFTRFLIKSMKNLDILSRAHRDDANDEMIEGVRLPSWVPPFHLTGTTCS